MSQAWSVYVELDARDVTDDVIDNLHERLTDASPAVGIAPNGNLSARVFADTDTVQQALDRAVEAVTEAARAEGVTGAVVGVEAVTEAELDRRLAEPSIPDLAGTSEVGDMLGVSKQRATQLARRDDFPPAVAHLKSGPVFVREQVEAFEQRWDRRGGRPPKPVALSPAERELLDVLRQARNAVAHSHDDPGEGHFYLGKVMGSGVTCTVDPVEGSDLLRVAYGESFDVVAVALDALRSHKLIEVRSQADAEEPDTVALDVELTPKGERVPIAS